MANSMKFDVNMQNDQGFTLLMTAVSANCVELVDILIDKFDADVNVIGNSGESAIGLAMSKGFTKIATKIIGSRCFNVMNESFDIDQGLLFLAAGDDLPGLQRLVECGRRFDIRTKTSKGQDAMSYACANRNMDMVRYLMKFPEVTIPPGMLRMSTGSSNRDEPVDVDVLEIGFEFHKLKANQKVRSKNLLNIAIEANKERFFNLLLDDPNVDVNYGSPLTATINGNKPAMFLRLLSHPAIEITNGYNGPVNPAIRSPNPLFLDHLTKIPKIDFLKGLGGLEPPLFVAINTGRPEVVRRLLDIPGMDLSQVYGIGALKRSAYQAAAERARKDPKNPALQEIVQLLLDHGAEPKEIQQQPFGGKATAPGSTTDQARLAISPGWAKGASSATSAAAKFGAAAIVAPSILPFGGSEIAKMFGNFIAHSQQKPATVAWGRSTIATSNPPTTTAAVDLRPRLAAVGGKGSAFGQRPKAAGRAGAEETQRQAEDA
jgi:ankyrin repeat protein